MRRDGNTRASKTFLFLCLGSLLWGLLWLVLLRAEAAAAVQPPAPQQNGTATAAALLEMQRQIFATQTAVAVTLQPATATSAPTSTPRPTSTRAALPTPSATPTTAPTAAPTAAPSATPSATPAATPTRALPPTRAPEAAPAAEVLVAGLNLRGGPGTGYAILGNAALGQRLPVLGQWGDCAWLRVQLADGRAAWTSGGTAYTRLNVPCSRLAAVAAPTIAAPTAAPTVAPTAAPQQPSVASAPPTATLASRAQEPQAAAPAPASAGGPAVIYPSSPPSGVVLNDADAVTFAWTSDAPLGPGQVFEVVFWQPGQNPNEGRAVNAASSSASVFLTVGRSLPPGPYQWGVFLARADPWERIRFLGEGGAITISGGGGLDDSGSGGESEPGGKDGKGG